MILVEIDPHEGDPNYFDFVTYFGLVSLSMGTIANCNPRAYRKSSPSILVMQSTQDRTAQNASRGLGGP